jgi:hypothetical protein
MFRLRLRLLHVMLDVVLIVCLVIFAVAWLVSNDWDCLMSFWKNHALFLFCGSIYLVFSFDALFGLTWHMLITCLTLTSHHKPLWSFSFWLLMQFYASLDDVLSLCMIMAVIALLVGAPSLLLALVLYWVWALLMHPTPKNQVMPMCPPYIPIINLLLQAHLTCFLSILWIKLFWCYAKISQ